MIDMDAFKGFLFIDQLKIMGYGESDTSGCWVKFQLTPELLEVIRGRKGEMVEVAARLIDNAGNYVPAKPGLDNYEEKAEPEPSGTATQINYGMFWRKIISYGFFNAPPVLESIGTDEEFLDWIRKQPSAISKEMDMDADTGEGRNEPAHVRRIAEGAGEGIKPKYYAIPLTHDEHAIQHQDGEMALLEGRVKPKGADVRGWTPERAKGWFERKAAQYRLEWASTTLINQFGYAKRRDCPPEKVKEWVYHWGLANYLPGNER